MSACKSPRDLVHRVKVGTTQPWYDQIYHGFGAWSWKTWVHVPALPLTAFVTLTMSPSPSESWFPCLKMGVLPPISVVCWDFFLLIVHTLAHSRKDLNWCVCLNIFASALKTIQMQTMSHYCWYHLDSWRGLSLRMKVLQSNCSRLSCNNFEWNKYLSIDISWHRLVIGTNLR